MLEIDVALRSGKVGSYARLKRSLGRPLHRRHDHAEVSLYFKEVDIAK